MKYTIGTIVICIGLLVWFYPSCQDASLQREEKNNWISKFKSATRQSYTSELSSEFIGQGFQWRHYLSPIHVGHVHINNVGADWDQNDPLGFFFAYEEVMAQVESHDDLPKLFSFWEDPGSKIEEASARYRNDQESLQEDLRMNRRVRQHWYAVADVIFENGDAGVLHVTYDDDGRVGGASFDKFTRVDGSYRFIQGEGMRISEERVILLDYLGLKDDGE